MFRFLIILTLVLAAGCAPLPETDDTLAAEDGSNCPAWKVVIEDNGRYYCVDREIFEEQERDWEW